MATLGADLKTLSNAVKDRIDEVLVRLAGEQDTARRAALLKQLDALEAEESNILALRMRFTAAELAAAASPLARADLDLRRNALKKIVAALGSIAGAGTGSGGAAQPGGGGILAGGGAQPAGGAGGGAAQPSPASAGGPTIRITETEMQALAKVAAGEVGHFGKYGKDVLKGGVGAVVDTILNRVAHPGFPSSVGAVVDQTNQFSPVNAVGTWEALPDASAAVTSIVGAHVRDRCRGKASIVAGATHFLNPFLSSASALNSWGNHVVANAVARFGSEENRDIHFHGLPPGGREPPGYVLAHGGDIARFAGNGQAMVIESAALRDAIVVSAVREWEFWGKSVWNLVTGEKQRTNRDDDRAFSTYIRDTYCPVAMAAGDIPGLTAIEDDEFYWSAVAISYMVRQAGVPADAFKASASHSTFIIESIKARKNGDATRAYWGFRIDDPSVEIMPGDIIGCTRTSGVTPEEALAYYDKTGWYPSHSDIVVARRDGEIDVIGGNVRDSVTMKTLALDANGRIVDDEHRWFVVMKKN